MTKQFSPILFNAKQCRVEIEQFQKLLATNPSLSERDDIQPFFKARPQLAAYMGAFVQEVGSAKVLAFEYPLFGDFVADLVLGDPEGRRFCVVEFEDGRPNSLFRTLKGKNTPEWSTRFEHGFSQIVDWFTHLDDFKKTERFQADFGTGHIRFSALLVIGRDAGLTDHLRYRLEWRTEKVQVDSHAVECITFDGLYRHMDRHLRLNTGF